MKKYLLALAFFWVTASQAAFVELQNTQEFEEFIANKNVPVIVQFSAYWCGPCKNLIATFKRIAPSYKDNQVLMGYVDADINSDLQHYLMGGYPTVRAFKNGNLINAAFVGSKSESEVKRFIDGLIQHHDLFESETEVAGPMCQVN